jgi:hypothetical protein
MFSPNSFESGFWKVRERDGKTKKFYNISEAAGTSVRILHKTSLLTEPYAFMQFINSCCFTPCIPNFSEVFDKCRVYEQLLICYIKLPTDDPQ